MASDKNVHTSQVSIYYITLKLKVHTEKESITGTRSLAIGISSSEYVGDLLIPRQVQDGMIYCVNQTELFKVGPKPVESAAVDVSFE